MRYRAPPLPGRRAEEAAVRRQAQFSMSHLSALKTPPSFPTQLLCNRLLPASRCRRQLLLSASVRPTMRLGRAARWWEAAGHSYTRQPSSSCTGEVVVVVSSARQAERPGR